jgi:hypothetical protein
MSQVLRSAQPLSPSARSAFLLDVAQELNGRELGDGIVQRTCKEIQKRYLDPPDLGHGGAGKYR